MIAEIMEKMQSLKYLRGCNELLLPNARFLDLLNLAYRTEGLKIFCFILQATFTDILKQLGMLFSSLFLLLFFESSSIKSY